MVRSGLPLSAFLGLARFWSCLWNLGSSPPKWLRPPLLPPPTPPSPRRLWPWSGWPDSPPHPLAFQAPPDKAPKAWRIYWGIFSVKFWRFPASGFGHPKHLCEKTVQKTCVNIRANIRTKIRGNKIGAKIVHKIRARNPCTKPCRNLCNKTVQNKSMQVVSS